MASKELEAALLITAKDHTRPGLTSAMRNVGAASKAMEASAFRLLGGLDSISTLLASGAAAAGLYKIGQAAIEGDAAFRRLGVTAGASASQLALVESALALGATGAKTSIRDLTASVDGLVTAGLALDTATGSAPTIAKTAKATGAAIEEVNAAAIALINNMKFGPSNLERAMDQLVKGGKLGAFEVRDMAREFPGMAASAAKLGIQGERGLSLLVSMAQLVRQSTATGSEAATSLTDFLEKLASPDVGKNLKKFGVDVEKVFKDAKGDGVKFVKDMLTEIQRLTKDGPFELGQIFGDKEARAAATALLKDLARLEAMIGEVQNSAGEMGRDFLAQTKGAAAGIDRMTAAWQTWLSVVSKGARPVVDGVANTLSQVLENDTDKRVVQQEEVANLEVGAKGKPFSGINADTVAVLRRLRAETNQILKGKQEGWFPAEQAMDAVRAVQRYYGAQQAYRDGRMPVEEFHGAADPYERRRAAQERREALYVSRGGSKTDAELAELVAAKRAEIEMVEKEANDPTLGGVFGPRAKEVKTKLEVELKVLEGQIRAREADARPPAAPGGVPLPTPKPLPTAEQVLAQVIPPYIPRPRDFQPQGSAAASFLTPPVAAAKVEVDVPAFRTALEKFELFFGKEPAKPVSATKSIGSFDPVTTPYDPRLQPPGRIAEKPDGRYWLPRMPSTPMMSDPGAALDSARLLGQQLEAAGKRFVDALNSPGTVVAEVREPVKVEVGKGTVDVRVKVEGPGKVVNASSSSSGNIVTNVGTSMPHLNNRLNRGQY